MKAMVIGGVTLSGGVLQNLVETLRKEGEPFSVAELAVRLSFSPLNARSTAIAAGRLVRRLKRSDAIAFDGDRWRFPGVTAAVPGLRAYSVLEDTEGTGGIVFARDLADAIAVGARDIHWGETEGLIASRVKWADRYSPGPVPFKAKFRQGWHQDCTHCGRTISEDAEYDSGRRVKFDIVERPNGMVFCRPSCETGFDREVARRKRGYAACVRIAKSYVRKRLGPVTFRQDGHHAEFDHHGRVLVMKRVDVRFEVPGHPFGELTCRIGPDMNDPMTPLRPVFLCSGQSAESFKAYAASKSGRVGMPA